MSAKRKNGDCLDALVFPMETSFQQKARRPGGIPRELALKNAKIQVLRLFICCVRPVGDMRTAPVRAMPRRRAPARSGYFAMAAGFKLD